MDDGGVLSAGQSWELVHAGRQHGVNWHSAKLDVDRERACEVIDRCQAKLEEDYDRVHNDRKNGNDDRIDLQVTTLERRAARQLARLQEVLQKHQDYGRTGLVRATEGRIREVELRRDTEVAQRESKREFRSHWEEMCVGVIRVDANGSAC